MTSLEQDTLLSGTLLYKVIRPGVCVYMCNCIVLCTYVYMCTIHTASHETFHIMTMAALLLPLVHNISLPQHITLSPHPPSLTHTSHVQCWKICVSCIIIMIMINTQYGNCCTIFSHNIDMSFSAISMAVVEHLLVVVVSMFFTANRKFDGALMLFKN